MSLSKTRQLIFYFCLLGVVLIVYAEASALRPAKQEPSISIDVPHGASHANKQPLEISVFFPTEMKFQNVSGKEISYFEVDISVPVSSDYAKDGRTLRWGTHPGSGKQENLLKPNEIATIAFDERLVKLYENAPTLSIQLLDVFFNNDASIKWRDGTWQERDKINPNVYHVIKDPSLPAIFHHSNIHLPSLRPLHCCNRENYWLNYEFVF